MELLGQRPDLTVAWGIASGYPSSIKVLAEGQTHVHRRDGGDYGLRPKGRYGLGPGAMPQATMNDGLRPKLGGSSSLVCTY